MIRHDGNDEAARAEVKQIAMKDYFTDDRDCFLFMGNLKVNPMVWIVGGLACIPKDPQTTMF